MSKQQSSIGRAGALVVLSAALAAAGCASHRSAPSPQVTGAAEPAAHVRVHTAAAEGRDRPATLALTGTLLPDQQSELTPLVSGRVMQVLVERGSKVHAGDPILRVRDVDFRTAAEQASAAMAQARAQLGDISGGFDAAHTSNARAAEANRDSARDALARAEQLRTSNSISDQDYQRARATAAAAEEQYNSAVNGARAAYFAYRAAGAQLSSIRRNVSDSVVRAPFDGEIAERKANVGEFVSPQRAVVTLVRIDPLRVELQVPQDRIALVREGQTVNLHVDAFPDRVFQGTVRYISASVRSDSRALTVEAVVPNADQALRPGLFVTANLALGRAEHVVAVPEGAIVTEGGVSRAFVVHEGRAQERVITEVERSGGTVLVSAGISAGERVVLSELGRMADGVPVDE